MEIEFGLLGPLSVVRDGVHVRTLSSKQRIVLAMLLVRANRVVALDSLVDGLWGDDPPATAVGVIQTYVSQLRKALEPGLARGSPPQIVVRAEPGYRLVVKPEALDANRFERLLSEGRMALRGGRADVAAQRLQAGLELWRGPALADVADAHALRAEAMRLDGLRDLAMEERIEAEIALGRHAELVGELETLVAEHELRERLWGQLMVCLYRSGRQADALAAYKRLRHRLNDELGLDPGPDLARLEHDILVHAPQLTWSPSSARDVRGSASSSRNEPSSNLPSWSRPEVFVGRLAELETLEEWWRDADSPTRMTLVEGESGIGKTRLATAFARRVEAAGTPVFYGRALEAAGSPYEPVLGALRQFAVGSPDEVIDAMSPTAAAALGRLVPELAERRPDVTSSAADWGQIDRSWLLAAVADCFGVLSTGFPLLVLDDTQWADRPALLLLSRLLAPETGVRVLATCRHPGGLSGSPLADFLADMRRDDRPVRRLALAGLSHHDVADLVAILGGAELSVEERGFAAALHRRTKGHPLFVRECILQLDADVGSASPSGDGLDRLAVPEGVREIVGQRLSRLTPATRDVLRSAAVLGVEFDLNVVSTMSDRPVDQVLGALEEAMAAGLAWEDHDHVDRFGFHHGMVHEVILDELSASRRARLEWSAGEALEARHQDDLDLVSADIARHFALGKTVGDAARAVTWARRAGDQALDGLAYEDAMRFYEMALAALQVSTPGDHATRADLLIALGRAADHAGDRARCRTACTDAASVARLAGDRHRLGRAAVTLLGTLGPGRDPTVLALMTEAAEALRPLPAAHDRALLAELLARLSGYMVVTSTEESSRLADEALQTARRTGDGRTLALALTNSTQTYALERPELESRLHEAARLAEASGDLELLLTAHSNLMVAALTWADRDSFDYQLAEYARVAAETRSPLPQLLSIIDHAGTAAVDGRYQEADELLAVARRRSESIDDPFLTDNINSAAFGVDRELGRLDAHRQWVLDESSRRPRLHAISAHVLCQTGHLDDARSEFEQAMIQLDDLLAGFTRRRTLAILAEAALPLRQSEAASVLAERMEPELRYGPCVIVGPNAFLGAMRRYLGLLAQTTADATSAVEHHQAALEIHQSMRAPGWSARSRYDLGLALRSRGRPGDEQHARELLAEARTAALHLRMPKLLHELQAVTTCS